MKNYLFMLAACVIAVGGCRKPPEHDGCTGSGGEIVQAQCCRGTDDFPNLCLTGPCGCAPAYSHRVYICDCGPDRCFDGFACVEAQDYFATQEGEGK